MMDAAYDLTDHVLGLRWADITPAARHAAATFLHDTLCVGIAGVRAPYADAVFAAMSGTHVATQGCTILGRTTRLPPGDAAFVNAYQIHAQEFDCVHEPAVVHPLATIVAVLLAEIDGPVVRSGPDVLTALVAGVDVAAGLGLAATTSLRFFRPATAGIFGSVAALAKLRGFDRETTGNALGYALAFASGTMQAHIEGLPTLPIQIAQAARSAIQAVNLAAAGLPGPRDAIEGKFGYLRLFEAGFDAGLLRDSLGSGFRIEEVSWKPFPTGRAAHGAIVATRELRNQHGVTADNLARLVYRAPPLIAQLVGRRPTPTMAPAYARLCFAWLGSVVLTNGTVGLDDFGPERRHDLRLLALAERIFVETDDNPDPAAFTPAQAVATLVDGTTRQIAVTAQFGSPAWPLDRAQHLEKAQACLAFADMAALHEPLVALIGGWQDHGDIARALNAALRHPTH